MWWWRYSSNTEYPYQYNNGTATGNEFCARNNLKCIGGWANDKNIQLTCTDNQGSTNSSWNCSGDLGTDVTKYTYPGNNGSVTGNEYCAGKNLKCIGGWAVDKSITLTCTDNQGSTNSSWICS